MPNEPRRINHLAIQFAQDGHLSFNQKWRSLVMQAYGHEGLIETDDLLKNGHCPCLNIDTYRLIKIESKHIAWRKFFNPCKWAEFILSWLEFLPWIFHYSFTKLKFRKPTKNKVLEFLIVCYLLLANFLAVLLHGIIYLILAIIKPVLAPVRHIIRPTIELAKENPQLFGFMLLTTFALITSLFAGFIFTGSFTLVIAGIAFTSTFATQLGVIALGTIILWTLLLKCHNLALQLLDLKKRKIHLNHQMVEVYPIAPSKTHTDNISIALYRLNPKYTKINSPDEQSFGHSFALFTGTEALFYPALSKQNQKSLNGKREYVHFEAQYFLQPSTPVLKYKACDFLNAFIQDCEDHINNLANIIGLELTHSEPLQIKKARVIYALIPKIQAIEDIKTIDTVIVLLMKNSIESNVNAAKYIIQKQPSDELIYTRLV